MGEWMVLAAYEPRREHATSFYPLLEAALEEGKGLANMCTESAITPMLLIVTAISNNGDYDGYNDV